MKLVWGLLVLFGIGLLVIGTSRIVSQQRRLSGLSVVGARILASSIEKVGRSSYRPIVTYGYEVSGRTYRGDRIYAVPESRGKPWARRIASRFPEGSTVDAWYKPDDPSQAVLLREYLFTPYAMVLTALAIVIGGSWFMVYEIRGRPELRVPHALPNGWYQLDLPATNSQIGKRRILAGVAWLATGVVGCGHFFLVADDAVNRSSTTGVVLWSIVGVTMLGTGIYHLWISRWMAPATVYTDTSIAVTGQSVRVRVEQQLRRNAVLKQLQIKFVCTRSQRVSKGRSSRMQRTELHTDIRTEFQGYLANPGDVLTADVEFQIPLSLPASKPTRSFLKPRIDWEIQVSTKVEGVPACRHAYPLCVKSAEDDPTAA